MDKDADGRITEEEVKEIITLSASANKLSKIQDQSEEYARLIMEELDPGNLGYIDLYNLEMLLLQAPSQSVRIGTTNSRNLSQMLSQSLRPTPEPNPVRRWSRRAGYFLEDNWRRVWVLLLWLAVCAALFSWKFVQYRRRYVFEVMGYCVCVAKGGAETTKLNMALVLLPVCRNTITWLRSRTRLGAAVPFNDNINFHKVVAGGVAVGVALHAVTHLTCDFPRLLHASAAARQRRRLRADEGLLRPAADPQLLVVRQGRGGRHRGDHGGAHGRRLHAGAPLVPPGEAQRGQPAAAAQRVQHVLVLPPPLRHRLHSLRRPRRLPLHQPDLVQADGNL